MQAFNIDPMHLSKHFISKIELYHVKYPLPQTFYPSWIPGFPQEQNRFDLIKITTSTNIIGYSAGPSMSLEREGIGYLIAPYLIGEDALDFETIFQRLREISYLGIRSWWIEPAFWDILGKVLKKPVCDILSGNDQTHTKQIQVYCSLGQVYQPEEAIAIVQERYNEGFRGIKLRVHDFSFDNDLKQVQAICQKFADKMQIGVDANQGWRVTAISDCVKWDYERAKKFADAIYDMGAKWLEEPLPMDDYENLSKLQANTKIDIAGGELHTQGYPELKMMLERNCYHIFQPDAIFTGGIMQTFEFIQLCKKHKVKYTPHTWTNGIGFAVNLHLMLASDQGQSKMLEYPLNPPGWTIEARDALLKNPFYHINGYVSVGNKYGLGIEIDQEKLQRFGQRFFIMDKLRMGIFVFFDRGLKTAIELNNLKNEKKGLPRKNLPKIFNYFNVQNYTKALKLMILMIFLGIFKHFAQETQVSLNQLRHFIYAGIIYLIFKIFYVKFLRLR